MYVELNIFSFAVLLLIFFNIRHRHDQLLTEQKLFLLLLFTQAAILVLDSLMWLLDGKQGPMMREIFMTITVLYYFLNPIICMIWYFYVDYQVYRDEKHLVRVLPITIPALINIILTFSSVFTGASFYLDQNNVYHRGPLFLLMSAIAFFYLIYTWILTVVKRKSIPKPDFLPIAIFMLPVIIGGVIQTFYYGVSLIWSCTTISILIIFINIQNAQLYTDHLTGLFNRRQLDRYLQNKVRAMNGGYLAGLMLDLDSFKNINDRYGHNAGDEALIATSDILKKTFRKNDFIARFGGDEFVVIMSLQEKNDLLTAIRRLEDNVALFNARGSTLYTISLSIGYDCFFETSDKTAKEFLKRLDSLMYSSKHTVSTLIPD